MCVDDVIKRLRKGRGGLGQRELAWGGELRLIGIQYCCNFASLSFFGFCGHEAHADCVSLRAVDVIDAMLNVDDVRRWATANAALFRRRSSKTPFYIPLHVSAMASQAEIDASRDQKKRRIDS